MTRSIAIASIVGGFVLALGMALLPFDAATGETSDDPTVTVQENIDCGSLLSHYASGPNHAACEPVATDRMWMVIAGVVAVIAGWWTVSRSL